MLGGDKSVRDSLILRCFGSPQAQRRNPANYSCIVRIADVTCLTTRLVRGDKDQVIVVQLTPTAEIRISKLEEKKRPIMVAMPTERGDLFPSRVDLHERFWTIDPKSKKVLYVNEAYEAITGRPCHPLMENSSSHEQVIHPQDRMHVLAKLEDASHSGRFDERFRIVRPEGEIRWVWVRGFPVRDAKGTINRLVGTALEITAQKHAEEQVETNLALAKSAWAEEEALRKATLAVTQNLRMGNVMDALLQSLAEVVPYT